MKTNIKFPVWAEIDLKALEHNFNIVKKMVGKRKIIPIIKANAYGHGIVRIAEFLTKKMNVNTFGVARVNEGILLRKNGIINSSIIILGGILKSEVDDVIEYDLEPAVFFISEIKYLGKKAREKNKTIGVHLKINTGMNRLGVKYPYHFYVLETIKEFEHLKLKSIYSHFANADTENFVFTRGQYETLILIQKEYKKPFYHIANSAAIIKYPFTYLDAVRPGIMLYGSFMDKKLKNGIGLKPVMSLKCKVVNIIIVKKGETVSYGSKYRARKTEKIAIINIGYGDGFRRELSNNWYVLIKGKKAKVIGTVCMDLTAIKVPADLNIKIGDEVLVFGKDQYGEIEVEDMAKKLNTISYEIFTGITERVPRIYKY